jgi:hypothetical protein
MFRNYGGGDATAYVKFRCDPQKTRFTDTGKIVKDFISDSFMESSLISIGPDIQF